MIDLRHRVRQVLARTPVGKYCYIHELNEFQSCCLPDPHDAYKTLTCMRPYPSCKTLKFDGVCDKAPDLLLTVVVPAYNAERWIDECLKSIEGQRVDGEWEIIVVDDGSTDGTLDIASAREKTDARIKVISQTNLGHSGARNTGISRSRGRFIVFVDSDDLLPENALASLIEAQRIHNADIVSGKWARTSSRARLVERHSHRASSVWARLYRREVWERIHFPEGLLFEDTIYPFCIEPLYKQVEIEDRVYLWRVNFSSITHTASADLRSIDSLWITQVCIDWCREHQIPLDQSIYDKTLYQLGSLLYNRTRAIGEYARQSLFVVAREMIINCAEFESYRTDNSALKAIELALRSGDYSLWRAECRWPRSD